jgi:hypothetical protein
VSIEDDLADLVRAAVRAEVEPLRAALLDRTAGSADAVTLAEAARRLDVAPRTVARWAAEPDDGGGPLIRTVKVGGARRVPTSEIDRLLAGQAEPPTPDAPRDAT